MVAFYVMKIKDGTITIESRKSIAGVKADMEIRAGP